MLERVAMLEQPSLDVARMDFSLQTARSALVNTTMSENRKPTDAEFEEARTKSGAPTSKKLLSFSIERILASDSKRRSSDVACLPSTLQAATMVREPRMGSIVELPWLSYTRYSPPKLP
ncbi:hypothetical protein QZH41_017714, partial [Actinostola sp. cb2023]